MFSNKKIFSLIILLFAFAVSCTKTEPEIFSISGNIQNYPQKSLALFLEEDINRKQKRQIAEIPIDENGDFKTNLNLEPHIYTIKLDEKKKLTLAIDKNQQINIRGDANDWSAIKISGSPDTKKLEEYETFRKESLDKLVISVRDKIKRLEEAKNSDDDSEIAKLREMEVSNYKKHQDELTDFVKNKMGTSIAVYPTSLRWSAEGNMPFLESLAADFEKAHPNSAVAAKINEKVKILKNTSIGGTATEINLPDKNGKQTALSAANAKYTLIDFWASWCPPCRSESETLAELYEKYNKKGFEIYGVSLDENKEDWLTAIKKDERVWTNVSTLQGFETPVTFEYAVTSLPAKFIIDQNGKIVAKNLHADELKEKIESLFAE